MGTFTAEVEVSLSDFGNKEIVSYVKSKMAQDIIFADLMKKQLSMSVGNIKVPCETLFDRQKIDFIQNNWDKLTLEKLENCIK
jgi:hypothetical protein